MTRSLTLALLAALSLALPSAAWAQEEEEPVQLQPPPDDTRPSDVQRLRIPGLGVLPVTGALKDGRRYRIVRNKLLIHRPGKRGEVARRGKAARRGNQGRAGWIPPGAGQYIAPGGIKLDVNAKGIIIINGKPARPRAVRGGKAAEAQSPVRRRAPAPVRRRRRVKGKTPTPVGR